MSIENLSELISFNPKKIPPFQNIKSGFKYFPVETDSNGRHKVRVLLYDDSLIDVSELQFILPADVHEEYHSAVENYIITKLGLKAVHVEPVAEPTPEPVTEPVAEPVTEPTPEPAAEPAAEPTPEPTPEPVAEPVAEPAAEPTPTPEPIAPIYYYLILDSANRMVFPKGFARNSSMNIVDSDGIPIIFAEMKLENNSPQIYNILPTNSSNIPILPTGCSKTAEGHIATPNGSSIIITYDKFVNTN